MLPPSLPPYPLAFQTQQRGPTKARTGLGTVAQEGP